MNKGEKISQTRKRNKLIRYRRIQARFNHIYSHRVEGCKLDFKDVVETVAAEFGLQTRTIEQILREEV